MASGCMTSWQVDGGKNGNSADFIFSWAPTSLRTVTAAMKLRRLLRGRKAMTNLDCILKSREITLLTKRYIGKVMVFTVVTCICEGWTIKKAECRRIDAFKLWCWRRLLRVAWTASKIKPVNLKGNQP